MSLIDLDQKSIDFSAAISTELLHYQDHPNLDNIGLFENYHFPIDELVVVGKIKLIPKRCFKGCTGLTKITFPLSVECIDEDTSNNSQFIKGPFILDLGKTGKIFYDKQPFDISFDIFLKTYNAQNKNIFSTIQSLQNALLS